MSALTLPGDSTPEVVARYREALLDMLGDADPLSVLRDTVPWAEGVVRDTPPARLRVPEAEGKWSVSDVLHHLTDSEVVWSNRLRRVLAEERPPLAGYDQDLWAARLRYAARPPDLAVTAFQAMRTMNLVLLDAASVEDLKRAGVHGERGEESVADMMRLYAGHDLAHRAQVERILGSEFP